MMNEPGSQPTYEELKHFSDFLFSKKIICSQPTYEELKPCSWASAKAAA